MRLHELVHARTGDKGDISNISVIAYRAADWPLIEREITSDRVTAHFKEALGGEITRYALPQLCALNFVIRGALTGGVTRSLALDAHGKCLASVLLEMEICPK
ncbi:hypothetical protein ATN84_17870 [Paramesorhizobium deserti]|uniref:AtuA-like ferredoxin-fold domain-containing protein n=1 Tax=Paramesorhizobium deserti TaxID=1494590 RepID=A0A135HRM5_9HYPH|nr:hypothetical protein [Paramesorhizobium deserti]KXF75827.1 hypothetical protein ATN84_17870 [Paramesorhizobium deserti]